MTPKVSVLMPVYKTKESYLREAIESILNQTYTDFELLILDDCPADSRESIALSYSDDRIRYKQNPKNCGISQSRNRLINMAQGEYLAIFDHDDISLPNRLDKEVQHLDAHPDVGVVSSCFKDLGSNVVQKQPETDHSIKLSLMQHCALLHTGAMIRKNILQTNAIEYEAEFSPVEDYRLWCRLISYTRFYNIQEPLVLYREHAGNTSHMQQQIMMDKTAMAQAAVRIEQPHLYQEFLLCTEQKAYVRLLGFPLLKYMTTDTETRVYLLGCIPVLKIRRQRVFK